MKGRNITHATVMPPSGQVTVASYPVATQTRASRYNAHMAVFKTIADYAANEPATKSADFRQCFDTFRDLILSGHLDDVQFALRVVDLSNKEQVSAGSGSDATLSVLPMTGQDTSSLQPMVHSTNETLRVTNSEQLNSQPTTSTYSTYSGTCSCSDITSKHDSGFT